MIIPNLKRNVAEALLRHAQTFQPSTDDARENARLTDALEELAEALQRHLAGA